MTQINSRKVIPKAYNPKDVEQRIYKLWVDGGYFTPKVGRSKKPFVIIMPPPNVTGALHMGHALTTALEDLMTRWHRMKGEAALYLPGTDHAGIATQVVVERMIAEKGLTRHDLGREKFVQQVWSWVEQYGDTIYEQLKRLGASCDWTRKCFTLDEGPSRAVRTTFVNLYKKGLIYLGEQIGNWCPRCATALSDLEVKHYEEDSNLYYIQYPFEQGTGSVTVATTRPETMLGDTAVAVNPEDDRYTDLVGKKVVLPVLRRLISVIADAAVDPDYGTGVLKVTPGHDTNDFEIGKRHGLPVINIMNPDGTLNENAGHYQDLDRLEVRKQIVDELRGINLLDRIEPCRHSVGHCDRCDAIVEPIVTKQWYMKMKPLAEKAIKAVKDGHINITPQRFSKIYFNWMYNIRDWTISRQLWWGHRIPVWHCGECKSVNVDYEDPTTCFECGSRHLLRDPDVLDTWFSSALWPHSTLGWPDKTEDLDYFYPTTVLETAHDILFFWVARMIMMGIENTGDIPFRTVYLHGLVRDPEGIKMSKTKGNVMDPLDLIDTYGADALRFALTNGTSPGNDMRLNETKMEASRNFANKLWNAARFVVANLESEDIPEDWYAPTKPLHLEDRWILSRLNRVIAQVKRHMEEYEFGEAQRIVHDFLWGDYCDWYVEMSKTRLRTHAEKSSPLPMLVLVLERTLRLLHPFMPFITEEIWQILCAYVPNETDAAPALIVSAYPEDDISLCDDEAEDSIEAVTNVVRALRNIRAEFRIDRSQRIRVNVDAPEVEDVIRGEMEVIKTLAHVEHISFTQSDRSFDGKDQVSQILSNGTITVPLGGIVDLVQEKKRLSSELIKIETNRDRLAERLKDKAFLLKAPEDVIERERNRLRDIQERQTRLADTLIKLDV